MDTEGNGSGTERWHPGWRSLAAAGGLVGLLAVWWRRRQEGQDLGERQIADERLSREAAVSPSEELPASLPECCIEVLCRPGWYDRSMLREVQIKPANAFVKLISSERVAGTDITATTIGDTIYFRKPEEFDPHSPAGLALLAHEIRHVEQYQEHGGLVGFAIDYVRQYLQGGYGEGISFEAEAYELQGIVYKHLEQEFAYNSDHNLCEVTPAGHRPNLQYAYLEPYPELPRQV